ncbi:MULTISPECIES: hypothetical protein [Gordonia]|uniref:Uncharacterized protein n=1 Tax=Gordonia aichiensis NBRC 108223 TaxID=1220583 RepID=L7KTD5_9ACTN|nr:hypothetical protein [Gordonia aichiensis]GAC50953.1 hypothetical protein GOACH_35_00050 [Gordonia aichiensis NBRC 108223]
MATRPKIQQIQMFEGNPRTNAWTFNNADREGLMVAGWALVSYGDHEEVRPIVWLGDRLQAITDPDAYATTELLVDDEPLTHRETREVMREELDKDLGI